MAQFIKPEPRSPDAPERIALSLILCSRNDQYMGNSVWRLQTILNYVAKMVHELNHDAQVEILVSDWGSDIPLRDVIELSPAAARMVAFLHIPPGIAHDLQKDSPFPEVLALNAAARRASGEYIGRIDQDTLVGRRFLELFFALYEGREKLEVPLDSGLLFSNRRIISYRFAVRCPKIEEIESYIQVFGKSLKVWNQNPFYQKAFWASYVGIWLLHRNLWQESGGYDERLIYYNWMEADMILRLIQSYKIVNLGEMTDYDFYHLEHYNPRAAANTRIHGKKNLDLTPGETPNQMNPNGENWGMINYPLNILQQAPTPISKRLNSKEDGQGIIRSWLLLSLVTVVETEYDNLYLAIQRAWIIWKRRTLLAEEKIRGEPIFRWPGLFFELWNERKSSKKKIETAN